MNPDEITRHHLSPRCRTRGVDNSEENILMLKWYKHKAWHNLFQNRTLEEAIVALKGNKSWRKHGGWKIVFGDKTVEEARKLLIRVKEAKNRENY